eukprot:1180462-Prorocentrum_minimum.AAC.2
MDWQPKRIEDVHKSADYLPWQPPGCVFLQGRVSCAVGLPRCGHPAEWNNATEQADPLVQALKRGNRQMAIKTSLGKKRMKLQRLQFLASQTSDATLKEELLQSPIRQRCCAFGGL